MASEPSIPNIYIAFEHFESSLLPVAVWKVTWNRMLLRSNGETKQIKCSDWFNTEESVWDFVTRKLGPANEIVAVQKFVLEKLEPKKPNKGV